MTPGRSWFFDELAGAGRENLDSEHASHYDTKEDADAVAEVELLRSHGLNADSELVDLGAGTGQLSIAAAAICSRVVAVDVSPVMLNVLQNKVRESGTSNLEVVQGGFLSYQHRGRRPDFVYSRFALHHLPDFWKSLALRHIRGVLREGGMLRLWDVVYNFDPTDAEEELESWCSAWEREVEVGWGRADVEEHIRDEHSTYTWILEPMMERCGFEIMDAEYSPDGIFAKYIARAN